MVESIMLNSVGAKTKPCLTPLVSGKASKASQSSRTRTIIPARAASCFHDFPDSVSSDCIEGLGHTNDGRVKVTIESTSARVFEMGTATGSGLFSI